MPFAHSNGGTDIPPLVVLPADRAAPPRGVVQKPLRQAPQMEPVDTQALRFAEPLRRRQQRRPPKQRLEADIAGLAAQQGHVARERRGGDQHRPPDAGRQGDADQPPERESHANF